MRQEREYASGPQFEAEKTFRTADQCSAKSQNKLAEARVFVGSPRDHSSTDTFLAPYTQIRAARRLLRKDKKKRRSLPFNERLLETKLKGVE